MGNGISGHYYITFRDTTTINHAPQGTRPHQWPRRAAAVVVTAPPPFAPFVRGGVRERGGGRSPREKAETTDLAPWLEEWRRRHIHFPVCRRRRTPSRAQGARDSRVRRADEAWAALRGRARRSKRLGQANEEEQNVPPHTSLSLCFSKTRAHATALPSQTNGSPARGGEGGGRPGLRPRDDGHRPPPGRSHGRARHGRPVSA